MTTTGWHIDDVTLERYAAGDTTAAVAASAEAHLITCADCRARLEPAVAPARLAGIWAEVDDRVEELSRPWPERALSRLGVPEDTARLLAATPSMVTSWLAALSIGVAFAVAASGSSTRGLLIFLTVAPMLPVAGVAAAYGRHGDPSYELAVSAPYSLMRLMLLRSLAVVGGTMLLTGLGSLLLLGHGWTAAAWLLPALALTSTTLALSARIAPVWAAASVLTSWVGVVLLVQGGTGVRLAAFGPVGQLVAAAVVAVAVLALVAQRSRFSFDTGRSA
ncbi:MAG TPA: zf-HC2 domain-containing protein [Actinomycetes bacterium]|jgi:hypothetical protein|nr:zf-HC2 domain-containing protein [Actinomycetes bacterium]